MFGFLSNNLYTNHKGQFGSGLSPRLWCQVTGAMMAADGSKRLFLVGDDFASVEIGGTLGTLHSEVGYDIFADDTSNHTITGAADENGGVVLMGIDSGAAANESQGICSGDGTQQLGQLSDTAAGAFLTAFECRVKKSSITTQCLLAGLGQPAICADGGIIDTNGGPMADKAFIGFNVLADDYDSVDFCYQAASATRNDHNTGIHTLVADTFVNLGFIYNPAAPASKRIKIYVNNVEQSTFVTAAEIATADFPDAEALAFTFQHKGVAGSAALEAGIDWWAFAQLI
jgi:hypothetical protein